MFYMNFCNIIYSFIKFSTLKSNFIIRQFFDAKI